VPSNTSNKGLTRLATRKIAPVRPFVFIGKLPLSPAPSPLPPPSRPHQWGQINSETQLPILRRSPASTASGAQSAHSFAAERATRLPSRSLTHVSARQAVFAQLYCVTGNLFRHAVQMLLKRSLAHLGLDVRGWTGSGRR
jgi:hypothetical protein